MRRLLVGIGIGVLAFGAGAVGAKVVTVQNPMVSDLDAAHHNISSVGELQVDDAVLANGFQLGGTLTANDGPRILQGYINPTVNCLNAAPGSLYLRHPDATFAPSAPGQFWQHPTAAPCDWTLVAGAP